MQAENSPGSMTFDGLEALLRSSTKAELLDIRTHIGKMILDLSIEEYKGTDDALQDTIVPDLDLASTNLSPLTVTFLSRHNILTVGDIIKLDLSTLNSIPRIGAKASKEIQTELKRVGFILK